MIWAFWRWWLPFLHCMQRSTRHVCRVLKIAESVRWLKIKMISSGGRSVSAMLLKVKHADSRLVGIVIQIGGAGPDHLAIPSIDQLPRLIALNFLMSSPKISPGTKVSTWANFTKCLGNRSPTWCLESSCVHKLVLVVHCPRRAISHLPWKLSLHSWQIPQALCIRRG